MNIFIFDSNPLINASMYCDRHLVKMILEHAQMLSTAVRLTVPDYEGPAYRITHQNHPCSKWVRESMENYFYLVNLTAALHTEWRKRYNHSSTRRHKAYGVIGQLNTPNLPWSNDKPTSPPLAMPNQYKVNGGKTWNDVALSYQNYFMGDKRHLAKWTNRPTPEWFT